MKGLKITEKEAQHLLSISKNIVDTIVESAPTNILAISSLMSFIESKTRDFDIGMDWLIADKAAMIDAHPEEKDDLYHLKEIKKAVKEGLLIDASVLIMRLKDDIVCEQIIADFKELNSFIHKAESLMSQIPTKIMQSFAEKVDCINEQGIVTIKNIGTFNEKEFVRSFSDISVQMEVKQEIDKGAQLPEMQDDIDTSVSPK